MKQTWKTVRIFISSTFRDMHVEREYLVKVVFPELRDRCAKQHLHMIDIDLSRSMTEHEDEADVEICGRTTALAVFPLHGEEPAVDPDRQPDAGEVLLNGKAVLSIGAAEKAALIGVLFQQGALFSSLSVAQNIMLPMREHTALPAKEQELSWAMTRKGAIGLLVPAGASVEFASFKVRELR